MSNLIDDMSFRQALHTVRNRTEAYHQLQGLIRKVFSMGRILSTIA